MNINKIPQVFGKSWLIFMAAGLFMTLPGCKTVGTPVCPIGNVTGVQAGVYPLTLHQPQARTNSAQHNEVLRILKQYSPQGYEIVYAIDTFPSTVIVNGFPVSFSFEPFDSMISGSIPGSLNTVVHEQCHSYTHEMDHLLFPDDRQVPPDDRSICYYTGSGTLLVKYGPTFPAGEINGVVPEAVKSFRYATYIYPSVPNHATQKSGIYGLLDEYNAYYHGTQTSFDLYKYYRNESGGKPSDWLEYLNGVYSTAFAYYEFKLYILNYLIYARQYHPDVYGAIIANKIFLKAYRLIDANWQKLIGSLDARKAEVVKYLMVVKGYKVIQDKGSIIIDLDGRSLFTQESAALAEELTRPIYRPMLDALR